MGTETEISNLIVMLFPNVMGLCTIQNIYDDVYVDLKLTKCPRKKNDLKSLGNFPLCNY